MGPVNHSSQSRRKDERDFLGEKENWIGLDARHPSSHHFNLRYNTTEHNTATWTLGFPGPSAAILEPDQTPCCVCKSESKVAKFPGHAGRPSTCLGLEAVTGMPLEGAGLVMMVPGNGMMALNEASFIPIKHVDFKYTGATGGDQSSTIAPSSVASVSSRPWTMPPLNERMGEEKKEKKKRKHPFAPRHDRIQDRVPYPMFIPPGLTTTAGGHAPCIRGPGRRCRLCRPSGCRQTWPNEPSTMSMWLLRAAYDPMLRSQLPLPLLPFFFCFLFPFFLLSPSLVLSLSAFCGGRGCCLVPKKENREENSSSTKLSRLRPHPTPLTNDELGRCLSSSASTPSIPDGKAVWSCWG